MKSLGVIALVVTMAAASTAHADEVEHAQVVRYPGAVALVDLAAATLVIGGVAGGSMPAIGVGVATYALGPALVHASKRNNPGALRSLASRVLLPVSGAVGGALFGANQAEPGSDNVEYSAWIGGLGGATIGTIAAIALDYGVFAKRTVGIAPVVAHDRGGLAIVGAF